MKKLLSIIILIFTLALGLSVFTACEETHVHEYPTTYSYNADSHWFECDCGEDKGTSIHVFTDGVCVCGYKESHTHSYFATVVNPTCEEQGYTVYNCACGDSYKDNYTNALNHAWGNWSSNNNGTHSRVCAYDNNHIETLNCSGGSATCTQKAVCVVCLNAYGEFLAHTYNSVVTVPTCEEQGFTTYTCVCNDSYVDNYVEPLNHNYGEFISNGNNTHSKICKNDSTHIITENCKGGQATETQKAICEVCNSEYGAVLNHTHKYNSVVTDPTCEDKGFTTYTCACGDSYVDNYAEPLQHDYRVFIFYS